MISLVPDLRRPISQPSVRGPLPLLLPRAPQRGLSLLFDFVGTAHFTLRSITDAINAASSGVHSSVAIELDRARFDELNRIGSSVRTPYRALAEGEFVAATDAFGNRDGDLWLIDWSVDQIDRRVRLTLTREELWRWSRVSPQLLPYEVRGAQFWEGGIKSVALRYLDQTTQAMREYFPSLYRVLIEERNLVMAARLAEITNQVPPTRRSVLVLMGMAHVNGVRELLDNPEKIAEGFERYGLNYSPPTRIRRARVT